MSYKVRNARHAPMDPQTPAWQRDRVTERGECFARESHHAAGGHGFRTVEALRAFCEVNNHQLEWADEYGEPGYSTEKGILLANWNDIPESLQKRLEAQGYALEWEDEWYVDSENSPSKAWRTSMDSMGWEPRIRARDGYYLTPDSDPQEWIDSSLNELEEPLPDWFEASELERLGFKQSNTDHDPGNRVRSVFGELRHEGYDVILKNARRYDYAVWTRREAKRELFLSDARGINMPKDFAECVRRDRATGISDEDYAVLEAGPDHEWYWDTWNDVCDRAKLTDDNGTVFRLEQDGDLWMVEAAGEFCEYLDTYFVHKE